MGFREWFNHNMGRGQRATSRSLVHPISRKGAPITVDRFGSLDQLNGAMGWLYNWKSYEFGEMSFDQAVLEGYSKNALVLACVTAFALGYLEAPMMVWGKDDQAMPDHALRQLFRWPNEEMGELEFQSYVGVYLALGGNAFVHKLRNGSGRVVGLRPYSVADVDVIPNRDRSVGRWVSHYRWRTGGGDDVIPYEDIIHLKWPSLDPRRPWLALSPLQTVANEFRMDTELSRYVYTLLRNDAVPRGVMSVDASRVKGDPQKNVQLIKEEFKKMFSGEGRGDVLVTQGGTYTRVGLNMEELATDSLRKVPESRVCAAFRVPPVMVGILVGLESMTYSNFETAAKVLAQYTLAPMWANHAAEYDRGLVREVDPKGRISLGYDLSQVVSLSEKEDELVTRVNALYQGGLITLNEGREKLGYDQVEDGDVFNWQVGAPQQVEEEEPEPEDEPAGDDPDDEPGDDDQTEPEEESVSGPSVQTRCRLGFRGEIVQRTGQGDQDRLVEGG